MLAAIIEYIKSVGDPKYYKPMKTPEATGSEKSPGEIAKPQAEKTPQASDKPQAADRPSDLPKEEGK